jgi:hypothetical protein
MAYLMLVFFFGAIVHYVYQSILAPSMRLDVEARLRKLHGELDLAERAQAEDVSRRCFSVLRQSHKRLLEALDRISVVALLEVDRELRGNQPVREQVEARSASFERCEIPAVRALRPRTLRIALQAVAINNGGLILSILPLMPFVLASARFRKWLLRLTVQAIDFHQQLGPAYVRVKHDVPGF